LDPKLRTNALQTSGERAACINQRTGECLKREEWVPVTLREMRVTDEKYGINTRVFRFNFHGAMQTSGMHGAS
jgi:hypothetical protein